MKYIIPFLISVLMGMGVGGGGLFIIYFTLLLDFPQLLGQGTNLLLFVISAGASLILHIKNHRVVFRQAIVMSVAGVVGSLAFSSLALSIDPKYPRIALGVLLVFSGMSTLYNIIKAKVKKFKKTLYK